MIGISLAKIFPAVSSKLLKRLLNTSITLISIELITTVAKHFLVCRCNSDNVNKNFQNTLNNSNMRRLFKCFAEVQLSKGAFNNV